MSLASTVQAVFAANASVFADALSYRTLTAGIWSSTGTLRAEIKSTAISDEYDDHSGGRVKRMRAVAKVYDTTLVTAPTLKLGDEIIDATSLKWVISGIDKSEIGNGIYRYHLVRDLPSRGEVDRGGYQPDGGATAVTGVTMPTFTALNEEVSAVIFFGAAVHRSATGVTLARNDQASKDAIGLSLSAVAVGETATIATENAFVTNDWTAISGTSTLTVGALYFLDATPGKITATPPTTGYLQAIGTAVTPTTLDLEIAQSAKL